MIGAGYLFRFQIFPNHSPEPKGRLNLIEDQIFGQKIDRYFEEFHSKKNNRVYMCAHNFWARDDRYIYIDLVCGKFNRTQANVVETEYGYQAPTRVEIDSSNQIVSFEQPIDGDDGGKHYNWLFPKAVQEVDRSLRTTAAWQNIHLKTLK
jgi:hypothetical protein